MGPAVPRRRCKMYKYNCRLLNVLTRCCLAAVHYITSLSLRSIVPWTVSLTRRGTVRQVGGSSREKISDRGATMTDAISPRDPQVDSFGKAGPASPFDTYCIYRTGLCSSSGVHPQNSISQHRPKRIETCIWNCFQDCKGCLSGGSNPSPHALPMQLRLKCIAWVRRVHATDSPSG